MKENQNERENNGSQKLQQISSCLWFDTQAEDAAKFYTSIFKNSSVGKTSYFTKEGFEIHGKPAGSVMTVEFQIEGQKFLALNGGPQFKFTEAVSFIVNCETQEEINYYWEKLSQDGDPKAQQCGWLKDKFGLSWQIAPTIMSDMFTDPNSEKSARVMKVFLPMKKIDIEILKNAYSGEVTP
ncbi:MAG: VOC family protein [Bacteroidia bacterium]